MWSHFRVLDDQLLVALDGPDYFSSKAIHCQNCLRRQLSNGQTLYYHAVITPVIVYPGQPQVLPCHLSISCRKTGMTNRTVNGWQANAGSIPRPSNYRPTASPYWAMISIATSPFVRWGYSIIATSSLHVNPTPIPHSMSA